jgi:hypothetical protein
MQVWMQGEVLTPGMQNGDHSGIGTQKFVIGGKTFDHLPGCFKQ